MATVPVAELIDPASAAALRQCCVLLAMENVQAHETLLSLGCLNAEERVAALLLGLFERAWARDLVSDRGLRLPLTQQDIADALGISPVHTNRMVMKLQRTGLIRLKAEWLQILDGPGLEALAQWTRPMAWTKGSVHASAAGRAGRSPARWSAPPGASWWWRTISFWRCRCRPSSARSASRCWARPARSRSGLRLAEAGDVDAAVLDVRLDQGQRVFPVAQTLQRRSIPFSFMTGYSGDPELDRFQAPVLRKPVETGSVAAVIEQLIH